MGTVRNVAGATIQAMRERYDCQPENILAGIGPTIGPDHYEVGADVIAQVQEAFGPDAERVLQTKDGSPHFDLWTANELQLKGAGVQQVEVSGVCTACHLDDWFSHRAEKGKTGRFGALMALQA
jgi:copper oxidase (laccase) domain-containing protein